MSEFLALLHGLFDVWGPGIVLGALVVLVIVGLGVLGVSLRIFRR